MMLSGEYITHGSMMLFLVVKKEIEATKWFVEIVRALFETPPLKVCNKNSMNVQKY